MELDRTGGPIGITLATDEGEGKTKSSKVGPIVISRFIILIHNPKLPIFIVISVHFKAYMQLREI